MIGREPSQGVNVVNCGGDDLHYGTILNYVAFLTSVSGV